MIKIYKFINRMFATGFYIGFLPGAPGTYGSLFALVLILLFPNLFTSPVTIIFLIIIGIITSAREEKETCIKDDPRIVIDEIAGMFIACCGISYNFKIYFSAFLIFRFFDIFKPFPVNKMQELPDGWGIMADDILAGVITRFILLIIGVILHGYF